MLASFSAIWVTTLLTLTTLLALGTAYVTGRDRREMRVPRMKLYAALSALPSAGLGFPKCRALVEASQAEVIANADEALAEVAESLNRLAQGAAQRRVARSHGVIRKWRTRRSRLSRTPASTDP